MDTVVDESESCARTVDELALLNRIAKQAAAQQHAAHLTEATRNRDFVRAVEEITPGMLRKLAGFTRPPASTVLRPHDFLNDPVTIRQLELLKTFTGPAGGGLSIKGAPYDFEWTARENFGTPMADRNDGTMELGVSSGSIPFDSDDETTWNGAGIGMRFTPRAGNPLIRFAPYVRFNYLWHNDSTLEVARNRGELGILVREAASDTVLVDRRVPLWNDGTGWYETHSDAQDGVFSDSTFFFAQPGREIDIWVWFNSSIDFNKMSGAFDFGGSRASNGLGARLLFGVIEQ